MVKLLRVSILARSSWGTDSFFFYSSISALHYLSLFLLLPLFPQLMPSAVEQLYLIGYSNHGNDQIAFGYSPNTSLMAFSRTWHWWLQSTQQPALSAPTSMFFWPYTYKVNTSGMYQQMS
jgi:hypothetical protein